MFPPQTVSESTLAHAVAAIVTKEQIDTKRESYRRGEGYNPFAQGDSFRLNHAHIRDFQLDFNGTGRHLLRKSI